MAEGDVVEPFVEGSVIGGKYVLRSRIGSGGAGEVWAALNATTFAMVAVKVVRGGACKEVAARFRHEAALGAALAHRNVVRVYDLVEERDGTLGLVMERLRGENARERMKRTGPLPVREAVSFVTQILGALGHAHDLRIVHRDIKPPNLFLATEPDGSITPKLLDFGVAKTPASAVHTMAGQLLGTPRYMSPEQIRAEDVDGRSDVFSVAVVLYELLTGRNPFEAPFTTASLAAVLEKEVEPDAAIPEPVWRVIAKALAKEPAERWPTAYDFADALRDAVEASAASLARVLYRSKPPPPVLIDSGSHAAVVVPTTPPPTAPLSTLNPFARRRRGHARRVVMGVAAASLAILAVAGVRSIVARDGASAQSRENVAASAPPIAASLPARVATPSGAIAPVPAPPPPAPPAAIAPAVASSASIASAPPPATAHTTTTRAAPARAPITRAPATHAATRAHAPRKATPSSIVKDPGF